MYKFKKTVNNLTFQAPSKNGKSKYDVYDKSGKFLVSFGSRGYQHYRDKLGYYSKDDHNDKERRRLFQARHKQNNGLAGKLAKYYLW